MTTISIDDLQRDPAKYVDLVAAGELVILLRNGEPVVELRRVARPLQEPRPFGLARGEFLVPDDFDAPLPLDVLKEFEGSLPSS